MSSQMAYWNTSSKDQGAVWDSVEETAKITRLTQNEAPTQSYREMHQRLYEKDKNLKKMSEKMKKVLLLDKHQVGMIIIFEGRLLGIEAYGSSLLWKEFGETALNGYLLDQYFLKDVKPKNADDEDQSITETLQSELKGIEINSSETTGLGQIFTFKNAKWTGLSLWHHESPLHLFAVKEHRKMSSKRTHRGIEQVQSLQRIPIERVTDEELEEDDEKHKQIIQI